LPPASLRDGIFENLQAMHDPPNDTDSSADNDLSLELKSFGPVGIISILFILFVGSITVYNFTIPLGGILVLTWVRLSHTSWKEIGYVRPKSWIRTIVVGISFGLVLKLLLKVIVMPLLHADPVNQSYHFLAGNNDLLPFAIWTIFMAGFGEETVFRGFLFERLDRLLVNKKNKTIRVLLITSVLFGLAHLSEQGWAGAEQAFITGLCFGAMYGIAGEIWMPMIAHAAFDLTALAIIYFDIESEMAHLFFN
jgi:uncharacterized protein